jgi:hypothetical protein
MKYKICVPSKGRYNQATTQKLCSDENFIFFVEEQEAELYKANMKEQIVSTPNGITVGNKRKLIVDWCIVNNIDYCFMLDDNIEEIMKREGVTSGGYPKLVKLENFKDLVLDSVEEMKKFKLSQMAISFKPNNWIGEEIVELRKRCWGFFILDINKIKNKVNFDNNLKSSEDFDFAISLLKEGLLNGVYYKYAFYKEMGSEKFTGGNRSSYNVEETKNQTEYIIKKHGYCCNNFFNEKHGIWEMKINWKKIFPNKGLF